MKKLMIAGAVMLIAGCSVQPKQEPVMGMANPASVYCLKLGGKLDIVNTDQGQAGYCNLPSGERIEEWTLYRRDNK
ncbi:putative hemolysin [Symbiopectobacterium purcellii]|uniref:DUF333 domain-containing protein n=1 Tax=Symbiopectobacterium purcellii TaxID=2871826 RepID=A0ABX9AMY7_9ENTR|nr:DUF333 domain-containing protein [Symbiopectobacterium purcellii]QZN96372.1 DUF333 domain-containing protein [Symbiopectobacterium purcellii]